jgi:hypothetical protein
LMKDGHHLVKENGSLAVVERRIANYLWSSWRMATFLYKEGGCPPSWGKEKGWPPTVVGKKDDHLTVKNDANLPFVGKKDVHLHVAWKMVGYWLPTWSMGGYLSV